MERNPWVWVTVAALLAVVALGLVLRSLPEPTGPDLLHEVPPPEPAPDAPETPAEVPPDAYIESPTGLRFHDLTVGSGAVAEEGDLVEVHYTGWVQGGARFDSSLPRGRPITLTLGEGGVIPGWEEGLLGMREGGERQLVIPSELGYGAAGRPPQIPGGATLIFDVELVSVQ